MDAGSFRAHVVRCLAHLYLSNFTQAAEDHEQAVSLCGSNLVLLERLEELKTALESVRSSAMYGASRTSSGGPVEWLGDFGLLTVSSDDVGARVSSPAKGVTTASASMSEPKQGLPSLIPTGEWMGSDVCEQLLDYTSYKLVEKALKEKEKGNAEFYNGNLQGALQFYSRAIKLNPDEGLFFSNRALVYLKLRRYEEAVTDCTASLFRGPSIKAFARRAAALDALGLHHGAMLDHRQALSFEPKNPDCVLAYKACLEALLKKPEDLSLDELALAKQDLLDLQTKGRISEERMQTTMEPAVSPPTTQVDQVAADKKKRAAGL